MIMKEIRCEIVLKVDRNGVLNKEMSDVIRAGLKAQGTPIPDSVELKVSPESGWPDCGSTITAKWSRLDIPY